MIQIKVCFRGINAETQIPLKHEEICCLSDNTNNPEQIALEKMQKRFPEKFWSNRCFKIVN